MNLLSKKWLVVWGLVLMGMVVTFWDYYQYRKIETQSYGHGPGDQMVSWKVDQVFQNEEFRIKYPESMIKVFDDPVKFENKDVKVSIEIKEAEGSLVNWENQEIASLSKNEQMYGERSYENTQWVNMTLIRFQRFEKDETYMVSRYLAKKNNKLFILDFQTPLDKWESNEGNIKAMARTLVLL